MAFSQNVIAICLKKKFFLFFSILIENNFILAEIFTKKTQ